MTAEWSPEKMVKVLKQGSGADERPVWMMPLMAGTTACYDNMLNSYDGYKRTVIGLTDPYLVGNDAAMTAPFDEWIGFYVAAIKTKQATGPYTFVGYSQGMHWAFAVAEALRKAGEETDGLAYMRARTRANAQTHARTFIDMPWMTCMHACKYETQRSCAWTPTFRAGTTWTECLPGTSHRRPRPWVCRTSSSASSST